MPPPDRDPPAIRTGSARLWLLTPANRMYQLSGRRPEASGVIPTIPLLQRISAALDADLIVQIAPHAA